MPERSPTAAPLTRAYWPASTTATAIRETTIGSVLREAAGRAPDKTALIIYAASPGLPENPEEPCAFGAVLRWV